MSEMTLRNAIDSVGSVNPGGSHLEIVKARRKYLHAATVSTVDNAIAEKRGLLASEDREVKRARTMLAEFDERIAELEHEDEARAADAHVTKALAGTPVGRGLHVVGDVSPRERLALVLQGPGPCPRW